MKVFSEKEQLGHKNTKFLVCWKENVTKIFDVIVKSCSGREAVIVKSLLFTGMKDRVLPGKKKLHTYKLLTGKSDPKDFSVL